MEASHLVVRSDPAEDRVICCMVCEMVVRGIPQTNRVHLASRMHGHAVVRSARALTRNERKQGFIHDFIQENSELKDAFLPRRGARCMSQRGR